MATFTNMTTLTYNGSTTNSNTVTGELLDLLSATKTAIMDDYTAGDDVTYVITIRNTGTAPVTGVSVTDDQGAYTQSADGTWITTPGTTTLTVTGTV